MNRRSFLQQAILAASALAIDPEKLFWEPGKKKIFIPKPEPVTDWCDVGWASEPITGHGYVLLVNNIRGERHVSVGQEAGPSKWIFDIPALNGEVYQCSVMIQEPQA